MIDLTRSFHIGMIVEDLAAAQREMGASLNLDWSPVRVFDPFPFWTPQAGSHEVIVRACYSRQGPQHLELCQGSGDFYNPRTVPDGRHIGVWVDDLPGEVERLRGHGWQVIAAGASPEDGYGAITYMQPLIGGLVIELVSTDLQSFIQEWLASRE